MLAHTAHTHRTHTHRTHTYTHTAARLLSLPYTRACAHTGPALFLCLSMSQSLYVSLLYTRARAHTGQLCFSLRLSHTHTHACAHGHLPSPSFIDPHSRGDAALHTIYASHDVEPEGEARDHPDKTRSMPFGGPDDTVPPAGASEDHHEDHPHEQQHQYQPSRTAPAAAAAAATDGMPSSYYEAHLAKPDEQGHRRRLSRGRSARRAQERVGAALHKRYLTDRSSFIRPPPAGKAETFT